MSLADLAGTAVDATFAGGTPPVTDSPTGRIGVAIPVPPPFDAVIACQREAAGDPLAWSVPPHVTLVPPIDVAETVLPSVEDHLVGAVTGMVPFEIHLCGTGTFRPVSPVVFVALTSGADEVAALEERVRSGVLGSERAFPFHPHVTLAHAVDPESLDRVGREMATFEARFTVTCVRLYRYGPDGAWHPVADHALGARGTGDHGAPAHR